MIFQKKWALSRTSPCGSHNTIQSFRKKTPQENCWKEEWTEGQALIHTTLKATDGALIIFFKISRLCTAPCQQMTNRLVQGMKSTSTQMLRTLTERNNHNWKDELNKLTYAHDIL